MGWRRTIALACLALVAGAGLWLLLAGEERRSEQARAAAAETPSPAARERVELATAAVAGEAPRAPLVAADEDEEARAVEADAPKPFADSVLLELVLRESGLPAARADVWYRVVDEGRELEPAELAAPDPERPPGLGHRQSLFRTSTEQLRADEGGLVRLPSEPGRYLQVLAQQGEHLGTLTIACEAGIDVRTVLELERDWELCVQVLHANGAPAEGIDIELEAHSGGSSWSTSEETGSDGKARFASIATRARQRPGASWRTGVSLPLSEPLERAVDPRVPLAEPLVLRLPPLAEVEVLVLEHDGRPVADGAWVRLGLVLPDQPRELSPFAQQERRYTHEPTAAGRALFRAVEPGFELEVLAGRDGSWNQTLARDFLSGPARAGERVQLTVRASLDHPVLVFRVLDDAGEALRDSELELAQLSQSGWTTGRNERELRTDAEGRFALDLPSGWKAGDRYELQVTAREEALGAALALSRAFENGFHSMGDLVLREPPTLAVGRVIDGAGQGVAEVEVKLEQARGAHGWDDSDAVGESDAEGEFALRGFVFGERLRLTPRCEGRSGAAVECEVGARGVELELVATGAVAGAVLLDASIPAAQLRLELQDESAGLSEEEEEHGWHEGTELSASGVFHFDEKLPGRYSLRIRLEEGEECLAIPGIEVLPGETCRDPRLAAIDLRGRLFLVSLRFLPPESTPGTEAELEGSLAYRVPGGGADEHERWHFFRGNPAVLVTPHASLDLDCSVKGYRSVRLADVNGEREVPLVRALRVRLVLPAGVSLPEPPTYLKATLAPEQGSAHGIDWGASAFDAARESVSLVGSTGRMRVQWLLERRSENGASATTLDLEPVQWVEVRDLEEQRFELEVSPEALATAITEAF